MKTEIWNGHLIRFVEKDGEWWAVAKDVTDALGFKQAKDGTKKMPEKYKGVTKVPTTSSKNKCPETQDMIILNEKGLYRLIMRSNKPEAEAFQDWVFDVIKNLRQSIGLEGFQIFRMLDKEHQKAAMSKLNHTLSHPVRIDFIKANTISNKIISDKHGYPKMIKKSEMTPDMLVERQDILDSTVELMGIQDKYKLDFSVSDKVREIVNGAEQTA